VGNIIGKVNVLVNQGNRVNEYVTNG
jgi:hypothetical protein